MARQYESMSVEKTNKVELKVIAAQLEDATGIRTTPNDALAVLIRHFKETTDATKIAREATKI